MAKRILKHILKNWNEYEVWNHKAYTVTEDFTTVTTEATLWTSPYDTSYWYTNITIAENSWIKWKEWAIYSFVVNSEMVVASDNRNVRVRIWDSWSWIPVFGWGNTILNWNDYLQKEQTRLFIYKTVYQSTGALHLLQDDWWWGWGGGTDYSWETKTISWWSVEIWLRTFVNVPDWNFTLTAPAILKDWEEYVIRILSHESFTMSLWSWITNPWYVDLTLSEYATDQYSFVAVWWKLELQPLVATWL